MTATDMLRIRQNPHWFPNQWSEGHHVRESQAGATRTAQTADQKQYCIPRGSTEINITIKGLKEAGVVIASTSRLTGPFGLCGRQMDLGKCQRVSIHLTRWRLQLQLLFRMWFCYWSKPTHPLAYGLATALLGPC